MSHALSFIPLHLSSLTPPPCSQCPLLFPSGRSSSGSRGRSSTAAAGGDGSGGGAGAPPPAHPSVVQMPGPPHHQGLGGTGGSSSSRDRSSGAAAAGGSSSSELRWRDRHYSGPRKWLSSALMSVRVTHHHSTAPPHQDATHTEARAKKPGSTPEAVDVADHLQMWPSDRNSDKPPRFTHIAALHSELIAVTSSGQIHQWRWNDAAPYTSPDNPSVHHPKAERLGLTTERVIDISASVVRCSVLTQFGKVATWVDDTLGDMGARVLEQPATPCLEVSASSVELLTNSKDNLLHKVD